MTTPPHDPRDAGADDEPLARPFLGGAPAGSHDGGDGGADDEARDVRPYVVTAGRTPTGPALPLEALVRTTARGETARAAHEVARILALCRQPQSIAELSAHLGVPVGVTRVLVADLTADDLVAVGARPAARDLGTDPAFIERLMAGVAAL